MTSRDGTAKHTGRGGLTGPAHATGRTCGSVYGGSRRIPEGTVRLAEPFSPGRPSGGWAGRGRERTNQRTFDAATKAGTLRLADEAGQLDFGRKHDERGGSVGRKPSRDQPTENGASLAGVGRSDDGEARNILAKLGMRDRVELTRYAIGTGLVEP